MHSRPWRRTFKDQRAYALWLERNHEDVEVHGTRTLEDQAQPRQGGKRDARSYSERYLSLPGARECALPVELEELDAAIAKCRRLRELLGEAREEYRQALCDARMRMRRQWRDEELVAAGMHSLGK